MEEYSTKVKITTETRAPLRQARIFFLYPSTIAGASIAAYVSLVRALAGKGEGFADVGNLAINAGVVAGAVFLLLRDLKGREQTMREVAIELGELEGDGADSAAAAADDADDADAELDATDLLGAPLEGGSKKKKKGKRKS